MVFIDEWQVGDACRIRETPDTGTFVGRPGIVFAVRWAHNDHQICDVAFTAPDLPVEFFDYELERP